MLGLISRKPRAITNVVENAIKKAANDGKKIYSYPKIGERSYRTSLRHNYRLITDGNTLKLQEERNIPHCMDSVWDDLITRTYEKNGKKVTTKFDKKVTDGKYDRVEIRTKNGGKTKTETTYLDKNISLTPQQYRYERAQDRKAGIKNFMKDALENIRYALEEAFV